MTDPLLTIQMALEVIAGVCVGGTAAQNDMADFLAEYDLLSDGTPNGKMLVVAEYALDHLRALKKGVKDA